MTFTHAAAVPKDPHTAGFNSRHRICDASGSSGSSPVLCVSGGEEGSGVEPSDWLGIHASKQHALTELQYRSSPPASSSFSRNSRVAISEVAIWVVKSTNAPIEFLSVAACGSLKFSLILDDTRRARSAHQNSFLTRCSFSEITRDQRRLCTSRSVTFLASAACSPALKATAGVTLKALFVFSSLSTESFESAPWRSEKVELSEALCLFFFSALAPVLPFLFET
mmetsp:Transcript_8633/g.32316  ORF Transcript_8633/g.32316 Transcript_8633/m.32316 type:complete len:224 (+) Transcript_8633:594-1265(+)